MLLIIPRIQYLVFLENDTAKMLIPVSVYTALLKTNRPWLLSLKNRLKRRLLREAEIERDLSIPEHRAAGAGQGWHGNPLLNPPFCVGWGGIFWSVPTSASQDAARHISHLFPNV